jgi:hypothetical protein
MKNILILVLLFLNISLFAQLEKIIINDSTYMIVDTPPEFIGGQSAMFKFLGMNIRYPAFARENVIEGSVYVGFVVDKDGTIVDVAVKASKLTSGIYDKKTKKWIYTALKSDESLTAESIRVVKAMPIWKPGSMKGKLVRVAYTLPLKFKLE